MKNRRIYNKHDVLDGAKIGLEFEFYSNMDLVEAGKKLGEKLEKTVLVPFNIPAVGLESQPLYHSPIVPTKNTFKLEIDYSGGKDMKELITGPTPFFEAKKDIKKVFDWIDEFGYTNKKCSIHVNISFDEQKLHLQKSMRDLNLVKFIGNFDEEVVYKKFPIRRDSVYARSINLITPNNIFFYKNLPADATIEHIFKTPNEKYFGINFTKTKNNYLEFRYIGGENYHQQYDDVMECVEYFILSLYKCLNFPEFTPDDKTNITELFKKQQKIISIFNNYDIFKNEYPDFNIQIDLNNDPEVIKSYWHIIANDIFKLVIRNNIKEGNFNYDTDVAIKQLYDTKVINALLSGFDLVKCKIEGVIDNCEIYYSEISHSRIKNSSIQKMSEVKSSKIENTHLYENVECDDCFIKNGSEFVIDCTIKGGIIRAGNIGKLAEVSDDTIIVEEPSSDEFITRDWTWIKNFQHKQLKYKNNQEQ